MLGMSGNAPDWESDIMMLYDVKPLENVVDIFQEAVVTDLLMEHCGIWIFGTGFFCR
jgi:hypothetical protein